MKKIILVFLLIVFVSKSVNAQIISTIGGGGSGGDGGPATDASIYDPAYLEIDRYGNIYFAEDLGHVIRKIDTNGIISTVAGIAGSMGFGGDGGPATDALLDQPSGVAFDSSGDLYIADTYNYRIRKVNMVTGIITTYAGNGTASYSGDGGPVSSATFYIPWDIHFDRFGNAYIGDCYKIRKVDPFGIITTICGNGTFGNSGDGGPATAALCQPYFVRPDNYGNLYFSDGLLRIRKINTTGIISRIAGDTSIAFSGDGGPATDANMYPGAIALDANGLLYLCDENNNRVRMIDSSGIIHTIAGNGMPGYSGDGCPPDSAQIYFPQGLGFDKCGNLYISQIEGGYIRKITYPVITPTVTLSAPAVAGMDSSVTVHASFAGGCCNDTITWMNRGVPFATTTEHSITYTKTMMTDSITVRVAGCGDTSFSTVQVVTDILAAPSYNASMNNIFIFPNPATSILTLSSPQPITQITITNLLGQIVYSNNYNKQEIQIDVSTLTTGIYFVKINNTAVRKFIKE